MCSHDNMQSRSKPPPDVADPRIERTDHVTINLRSPADPPSGAELVLRLTLA